MKISIVIPAYNEEKRIGPTLHSIISYCTQHKITYEIILVDDGSTDHTIQVAKNINTAITIIKNNKNKGKGYSVKQGIQKAKYDTILFTDADLATPIEDIEKLLPYLKNYDIVIGSRYHEQSQVTSKRPLYRKLMGATFALIVRILSVKGFRDTQCGFKLFKAKTAKYIAKYQRSNGYVFDVEVLVIAKQHNYAIKEVPIRWHNKEGSKISPIRDPIRMFFDLCIIRLNIIRGKYNSINK